MKTPQGADFTGQNIYVGIDVHLRTWKVSILSQTEHLTTFSQEASSEQLLRSLRRSFAGARLQATYEAGFSGFWLAHVLRQHGIDVLVVHPADVPTSDRQRRYKRDRGDARKLAEGLRARVLRPIYVPSPEQLADRTLVRTRYQLVGKQTRVKNQVKSHLHFFGIAPPPEVPSATWSACFLGWLDSLTEEHPAGPAAGRALALHLAELRHLRVLLLTVTRHIRERSRAEAYRRHVDHLVALPGIGMLSAMVLLTEIMDVRRFRRPDELASFAGLTPRLIGSGERETEGPITPRRSRQLRRILVESAWVAARNDLALREAFARYTERMTRQNAIIRIARKQLNRVRYVLHHERPCTP